MRDISSFLPQHDLRNVRRTNYEFYQACSNIIIPVRRPEDVPEVGLIKVTYSEAFAPFSDRIAEIER